MKTQVSLAGDAKTLDALARFLQEFEKLRPELVSPPKAIRGEDNVIYVEAEYQSDEDTFRIGDRMAEIGADLIEETGVLVAFAPFLAVTEKRSL